MHILETSIYTDDLDAAEHFYHGLLGLPVVTKEEGRHVFFRCGPGMLLVFNPAATGRDGSQAPPHGAPGPGHFAFAVRESEFDAKRSELERLGIAIERDVSWRNGARSAYFRDPKGNSVEIATPRLWGIPESEVWRD